MPVFRVEEVPWAEPPGHVGGYSKYLISPESHGSQYFDFRISRYPIAGRVEPHVHEIAEHAYYFVEGTGIVEYGDERHIVTPGTVMFVPPGVRHAVENTGDRDMVFIVATSPPTDIPR